MRYVPVDGRTWRHTMGLRPLEVAQWLEFGDDADAQLALKRTLLDERRDDVLALRAGSDSACDELLEEIVSNVAEFHPGRTTTPGPADSSLAAASRLVAEDLCVLLKGPLGWTLEAACVCFPSRWRLADKIGRNLDAIHAPVPGYDDDLAAPTNRFFDRLDERAYWRLNWTLLDDGTLFQPAGTRAARSEDPEQWRFRVERQTLRRLSRSGAAVFTIRTYVAPARQVVEDVEGFARDVAAVLETAPSATLDYKGWRGLATRWREWFVEDSAVPG